MSNDRSNIIGGSDISAIMGLSRWCTPLQLWAEKTGKIEKHIGNPEALQVGKDMEEYVSSWFAKETGKTLRKDNRTFKHEKYPYMVGHIDRWVVGEEAVFEAKTANEYKLKEWQGDSIPAEYLLQVMWYLGILKKKVGHIACLVGGNKRLRKDLEYDDELFQKMVEAARNFHDEYLVKDVMPMVMAEDSDFLVELYPTAQPDSVIELEGEKEEQMNLLIEERVGGKQVIKDAQKEIDLIDAKIKMSMGESEMVKTGQYYISWKNQIQQRVDTQKLKAEGLFERFKKDIEFRTLRTKKLSLGGK